MAAVSPMASGSPENSMASTELIVTHHTDTADYLGHNFHGAVGSLELWLGAQALIFNILVIIYYRAMFQRIIPMLYLMIAACDAITGVAAVLTGILILSVRSHVELATDLSYAAYFVYSVTIPTSIFLNVNLAVIRTINLYRPLYQISKRVVGGVVGLVAVGWIITTGWNLSRWDRHRNLLRTYIYSPGQFQIAYHQGTSRLMECANTVRFVTVPYLLPSVIVVVCMAVQLQLNYKILQHVVRGRKQSGDTEQHKDSRDSERWRQQRHVTITILCLTLLFFVCNTVFLYLPLSYCLNLDVVIVEKEERRSRDRWRHITGVVFPFINAAFSPVILVVRGGIWRTTLDWVCSRRKQGEEQVKELDTVLSNNTTLDNVVSTNC